MQRLARILVVALVVLALTFALSGVALAGDIEWPIGLLLPIGLL